MKTLEKKYWKLNRLYKDYRRNPESRDVRKALQAGLTELALDLTPKFSFCGDSYKRFNAILDCMCDYTLDCNCYGDEYTACVINQVYNRFAY
jgi:hypothetical protein